jgi:predicted RND superfamily exporter protein
VLVVLGLLRLEVDTGVDSFLPDDASSARDLAELQSSFGGDPLVVLLTGDADGALLAPETLPDLLRLEGELAALDDVAVVYGPATAINQVAAHTQQLLARVSGRRDGLRDAARRSAVAAGSSPAEAQAAAEQATAAFDQRYGSLLAGGLDAGLPTLGNAAFVRSVAYGSDGRPRPQYRFVLPSPRTVAVLVRPREHLDQLDTDALARAVRSTVRSAELDGAQVRITGTPALSSALAERVRHELPVVGALAVALVGATLVLTGGGRRRSRLLPLLAAAAATTITLAVLGLVGAPLSLGMLALMPILIGIGNNYPVYLSGTAARRSVAVVGVASAAAFGSLGLSPLPFVRGLGLALCVGVLGSLAVALLTVRPHAQEPARPVRSAAAGRRPLVLLVAGALVAGLGWWQLPSLAVEASPQSAARGLPAVTEAQEAERVLGVTGEVAVVLRGPDVLTPESLAWSRAAEQALVVELGDRLRVLASPQTLLGFLGESPTAPQVLAAADLVPPYLLGAVVRSDRRESVVTLGVRIADLGQLQELLEDVRAVLPPAPAASSVRVAGLPVVAVEGYDALTRDRLVPNLVALLVLAVVTAVGLRRRRDALWAVGAAALAAGWGFAVLAAVGGAVSPLTTSLGALVAAVGCEFTILGLHAARSGERSLLRAVCVAAATGIAGFLALLASDLRVIQEFGLVLVGSLVLACLASLLVVAVSRPRTTDERSEGGPDLCPLQTTSPVLVPR